MSPWGAPWPGLLKTPREAAANPGHSASSRLCPAGRTGLPVPAGWKSTPRPGRFPSWRTPCSRLRGSAAAYTPKAGCASPGGRQIPPVPGWRPPAAEPGRGSPRFAAGLPPGCRQGAFRLCSGGGEQLLCLAGRLLLDLVQNSLQSRHQSPSFPPCRRGLIHSGRQCRRWKEWRSEAPAQHRSPP